MYKIFNWNKFDGSERSIKALGFAIAKHRAVAYPFPTPYDDIFFKNDKELEQVQNFRKGIATIQNLSTTADFPEFLNDLVKSLLDKPISDIGYQAIYDIEDLTGVDGWDVYTETNDFEFPLILPGGRISYYTQAGTKYRANVNYYGGGNGIDKRLLDTRKFVTIEKNLTQSRAVIAKKEAQVAYALIEAIGSGQNTAWAAPDPSALANTDNLYNANRDAQTMLSASNSLIDDNKDKGLMPDGLTTNFFVLYPYQLQTRLKKANSLRLQGFQESNQEIGVYKYFFIGTTLLAASDKYYVGIPKGKLTGGMLLALQTFMEMNQTNYTQDIANWKAFGFDIGDEEQIRRCSVA